MGRVWISALLLLGLAGRAGDGPEPVKVPGIENLYRLGQRLYSGGQPEGEAAFAGLARLGVRTIVSVDGAAPDVETARKYGLRYVHLPIGYDGVPSGQAARLVRLMRSMPGSVYVHCHHGKHRGPAAAAVCGIASEGWDHAQARAWLEIAGTDPAYPGLFATVARFETPDEATLRAIGAEDLPERVEAAGLVESMVAIDGTFDRLKAIAKAGFRTPESQPDLDPPHEARGLVEAFREAGRLDLRDAGTHAGNPEARDDLRARLANAEASATELEQALRAFESDEATRERLESAFAGVTRSCTDCHAAHRDQ